MITNNQRLRRPSFYNRIVRSQITFSILTAFVCASFRFVEGTEFVSLRSPKSVSSGFFQAFVPDYSEGSANGFVDVPASFETTDDNEASSVAEYCFASDCSDVVFVERPINDDVAYFDASSFARSRLFARSPFVVRGQAATSYWSPVGSSSAAANAPIYVAQTTNESAGAAAAAGAPIMPETSVSPATSSTFSGEPIVAPPISPSDTAPLDGNQSGFSDSVSKVVKFWNRLSAEYTFVPKSGSEGLGMNEFQFCSRFAVPCSVLSSITYQQDSKYFYIVPGFELNLWSGMKDTKTPYQMPSSSFDANLAFNISPRFSKDFGVDAWVQVGLASSFQKIKTKAIYVRGRAMGNLVITDKVTATGGVIYYCRNRYKLLPSGGIVWKPNQLNEWRLVFPDPRLSRYLKKVNETDWWAYVQGNIGGGRWLISDNGETFNTDYNDYRVGIGLLFDSQKCLDGHFEVGGAFGRELYAFGDAWFKPKSSLYLKGGISY